MFLKWCLFFFQQNVALFQQSQNYDLVAFRSFASGTVYHPSSAMLALWTPCSIGFMYNTEKWCTSINLWR